MLTDIKRLALSSEFNGLVNGRSIKVLIVDDSPAVRRLLKRILTEAQYEVVGEAKNGLEAVELYFTLKPDVVTMDITMPEMEGIEALKQIKKRDPKAKVIMLTSLSDVQSVKEAILAGAANYVIKPLVGEQICKLLKILKTVAVK